ncbi:hypothetical protein A134_23175 [Vibrio crassostreae 9CS106]|uniref:Uncharacterized protein n=1 Tax=Vibrio crassostreae 9CS106 TaxID=1191300 RepID=A0A1B1C3L3_9VIBR|nr:hypothetical protein A134_23175 [Vibrio crassostreae 9CS106]
MPKYYPYLPDGSYSFDDGDYQSPDQRYTDFSYETLPYERGGYIPPAGCVPLVFEDKDYLSRPSNQYEVNFYAGGYPPTSVPSVQVSFDFPYELNRSVGEHCCEVHMRSPWARTNFEDADTDLNYEFADFVDVSLSLTYKGLAGCFVDSDADLAYEAANPIDCTKVRFSYRQAFAVDRENISFCYREAQHNLESEPIFPYLTPSWEDADKETLFFNVNLKDRPWEKDIDGIPLYMFGSPLALEFSAFTASYTPPDGRSVNLVFEVDPQRPVQPRDAAFDFTFDRARNFDQDKLFPWKQGYGLDWITDDTDIVYPIEPEPEPEPLPEPPEGKNKRSYVLMNTVMVYDVATKTPIAMRNISINMNIDSFVYSLSGTVIGSVSMNLIKPDAGGLKEVEVHINGWKFKFVVESYNRSVEIAKDEYSVTGATRQKYLAAPLAPKMSGMIDKDIRASQQIQKLLPQGFKVEFTPPQVDLMATPDWIVKGGTYSYSDKTSIEIISEIVESVGAVIVPDMVEDIIYIQPRYRLSRWRWTDTNLDDSNFRHQIPERMIKGESGKWMPSEVFNAIYVSGIKYGVAVNVTQYRTNGRDYDQDYFSPFVQDVLAAAEKGRNVINESGNKEQVTLSLMIPPKGSAPELVMAGNLAMIKNHDGSITKGLVISNQISVGGINAVYQNVTLELDRNEYQ